MSLYAHLILVLLLATVLTPLLGTVPLRGWRWDRQCWWLLGLLSIGMPLAVGHRFVRLLLPGVGAMFIAISLAGLDAMLRAEREGAAAPSLWWRRLARGFAAAGIWVALALAKAAVPVKADSEILNSTKHASDPPLWIGCALATTAVLLLLWALGRCEASQRDGDPSPETRVGQRTWTVSLTRCLGAALLLGLLAAALLLPWSRLQAVGADVLGYLGYEGYAGDVLLPDRLVAKPVLASLASVTLILWGFQALWARIWRPDCRSL
jgi:hypothetical protein